MNVKKTNEELVRAEFEIEELAMQLADMLGVALHFAGVKKDDIPKAVDAYLDGIDECFGEDEDGEMGFEEVVKVITHLQNTKPELFK
ncbi:hypothetical protein JWV37_03155 [Sulfurospirillum sp. T05]|uniref:Uncharacterized protein n=1 Tax=Sulfurospirillum tamanense TaxID=2813362 RepID=A0ABS2WQ49_9BACT|nr:hypothetical protein [Sulfurospirillum tamanensis]MBN2963768.1 hypothetical protein [Sulfurospirillum tamanensis]